MILPSRLLLFLFASIGLVACSRDEPTSAAVHEPTENVTQDAAVEPPVNKPVKVYANLGRAELTSLLEAYRSETGNRYEIVDSPSAIAPDLSNVPKQLPKTDLYIAGSLAEIWAVAEADGLRPVYSSTIDSNVRSELRDPESRWVSLSVRARVIVYNTGRVSTDEVADLQKYAALGDEIWKDRLCLSSSRVPGNRSLVAHLIKQSGVRDAESIVRRWRANFGTSVFRTDAALLAEIAAGNCAIGVVDSSEFHKFSAAVGQASVVLHWFDDDQQTMFDISGAGVSRHATDPVSATTLLEWFTSKDADALFAIQKLEYPANSQSQAARSIEDLSAYVAELDHVSGIGFLQEDAAKLIERARYP